MGLATPAQAVVGDLNWRRPYDAVVAGGWSLAPVVASTKGGTAAPTRCIARGAGCVEVDTVDIPGVPHNLVVRYALDLPRPTAPKVRRLRRCAAYQWHGEPDEQDEMGAPRGQ